MLIGILVGMLLPVQTGVNGQLRSKLGSPFLASLASFSVALLFLIAIFMVSGQEFAVPVALLMGEPLWIWIGGVCGGVVLTGNILLISRLDSIQTALLPILGQVLMGLAIDTFGLLGATPISLAPLRLIGASLAVLGVAIVAMVKAPQESELQTKGTAKRRASGFTAWIWRVFGIATGAITAVQAAVNGHLGIVVGSPLAASVVSFVVGTVFLGAICFFVLLRGKSCGEKGERTKSRWWMWTGGFMGALYLLMSVTLASSIGVGATLVVLLAGTTAGGLLIDHLGLLGCERRPINVPKATGAILAMTGAMLIKIF